MYDTIHLRLRQDDLDSGANFIEGLPPLLTDVARHERADGDVWYSGNLGNLSVTFNRFSLYIKDGSLCRWFLGDNLQTMKRGDVRQAIECLSDTLYLPMNRASVTRLDIAANLIMQHPVSTYLEHLGVLSRYKRLAQPSGIYYTQHDKRLCFYDKIKEQRAKRAEIPGLYEGQNVLRYEQRYTQRVASQFKLPELKASTLYDADFYSGAMRVWRDTYKAIRKINEYNLNFGMIKGKKDLQKMGVLALVNMSGGQTEIIRQINDASGRGELTSKQALDLRRAVNDACKADGSMVTQSNAVTELDKKIAEAVKIYG